jgi:hypothetical protein
VVLPSSLRIIVPCIALMRSVPFLKRVLWKRVNSGDIYYAGIRTGDPDATLYIMRMETDK